MATYYLSHAGIKGMKWGIRRWQNKDGSLTPEGKIRYGVDDDSDSAEDYKRARAKSVRDMSDKELTDALNRVRMEQQYAQLTAVEKSAGRKWVEGVLSEASKEVAKHFIVKYSKIGVEKMISGASRSSSVSGPKGDRTRDITADIKEIVNKKSDSGSKAK